jgi:hypothetical protein
MINRLNKIKEEINRIQYNNTIYLNADDVEEICELLSDDAAADIRKNGYKDDKLIYKNLKTSTLIEIAEIQ